MFNTGTTSKSNPNGVKKVPYEKKISKELQIHWICQKNVIRINPNSNCRVTQIVYENCSEM